MTKLYIYSDLHLEFAEDFTPPEHNPDDILVLAGDTSSNPRDIGSVAEMWTGPIVAIAGNHEYYSSTPMEEINVEIRKQKGVTFLDNESVKFGDLNIFGGTMWTDFCNRSEHCIWTSRKNMNDYKYIYNGDLKLTPNDVFAFHMDFMKKLEKWLQTTEGKRIVITHHKPFAGIEAFGDPLKYSYNSLDTKALIEQYEPDFWIFGHTHEVLDKMIGKTRIISNARGYPAIYERRSQGFDENGLGIAV